MTTGRINQISIGAVTNSLFDGVFDRRFIFDRVLFFFDFEKISLKNTFRSDTHRVCAYWFSASVDLLFSG